ncbi:MAG: hypothetical protein L3J22_00610 [Xanthomonadales bacterium]|nr:hypothetical protein [Xanthomonadales bacterium]
MSAFWGGGAQTFINKGINWRWRDLLLPSEVEKYETLANSELTKECAHWLASGEIT